ncbi:DUF1326 domain-containing protein, partial [Bacillus subtilis]|nr:DUF1326 domain-containing protein [Bacillus subtilis]
MTPWEIQGTEMISCNCSYGCPCQFNALPTNGNCEAMGAISIDSGHYGDVVLDGHAIGGLPSHKIALKGLVRTFQNIRLFKSLTVVENLLVAQHRKVKAGLLHGLFATPAYRHAEQAALERAAVWLDRMGLTSVANRPAGTLSYGHQRRLEIARCMITEPRLLM